MTQDQDHQDGTPHRGWLAVRAQEENHAFILRIRLAEDDERVRHAQFRVEEVGASRKQRFSTFLLAVEWLGERINQVVPGQVEDRGQS